MQPSQSGSGHCPVHGYFYGYACPGCTAEPPSGNVRWANPYTLDLQRIAAALERIAAALETEQD